jgi:hypothetical protein
LQSGDIAIIIGPDFLLHLSTAKGLRRRETIVLRALQRRRLFFRKPNRQQFNKKLFLDIERREK